ncbi:uncharacterized peroxidase-related enzyme [Lentzea albidocapillata subsp. violacea]|uniref:Uncharacterized peroxidase-related enzyme n=1 Tax=Lentzea albidocapillata subsp. violacea TaxID=128104 RepID=A0A1H0AMI6_9PSEU|nr:peroxidase-related enzyme [Lentzea albidocapillata]SDN34066.1 uncharacterized peroxidase-related enzyme [Lentzea albidocapillata subsp. violacea]
MPYLPSLPENAALLDVFRAYPDTAGPLIDYHEVLLRGPSPLSVAERELIAVYVSGVNSCGYCHGVHTATAAAFGIPGTTLTGLLADIDTSPVNEPLKPLLRYVGKLTRTPSRMTRADADAVFAAGWDERALHDAVSVCALFNFMNRLVEGLGISASTDYSRSRRNAWPKAATPGSRSCSATPGDHPTGQPRGDQRTPGRVARGAMAATGVEAFPAPHHGPLSSPSQAATASTRRDHSAASRFRRGRPPQASCVDGGELGVRRHAPGHARTPRVPRPGQRHHHDPRQPPHPHLRVGSAGRRTRQRSRRRAARPRARHAIPVRGSCGLAGRRGILGLVRPAPRAQPPRPCRRTAGLGGSRHRGHHHQRRTRPDGGRAAPGPRPAGAAMQAVLALRAVLRQAGRHRTSRPG